jgi:hypothetical protein
MRVARACALKAQKATQPSGKKIMFRTDLGKLTVYASAASAPRQRLQSVKTAAEAMAKQLNLNFEMVKQAQGAPIYVYYESGGDEEPIPIYCDEGKTGDFSEISTKIRSMMFVLSFHPRHAALRQARKTLLISS